MTSRNKLHKIYHDAFPAAERRPWDSIVMLSKKDPRFSFIELQSEGKSVGLATTWDFGSFVYVEHLAVDPAARGAGIGSTAINEIARHAAGRPVVLEVEPPTLSAQASRRIAFYRRAGFKLYDDFPHTQPPYVQGMPSVEMRIMSNADLTPMELETIAWTLHREVYNPAIAKETKRMKFKDAIVLVIGSVLALLLSNLLFNRCGAKTGDDSRKVAVVSLEPLRAMVADIAGPSWEVVSLMPPGANPESFDPTIATLKKIEQSDVFFFTGSNSAEERIVEKLGANTLSGRTVDLTTNLQLMRGTHGDHDHEVDPHIWTSLRNLATMATDIAGNLARRDPANADAYINRADSLTARYRECDSTLTALLSAGEAKSFVVNHPSLSYFARDYGLEQIALGGEHKEMSTRRVAATLDEIKSDGAKVFFVESAADSVRATNLATQLGLRLVVLPTNTASPVDMIVNAATSLR